MPFRRLSSMQTNLQQAESYLPPSMFRHVSFGSSRQNRGAEGEHAVGAMRSAGGETKSTLSRLQGSRQSDLFG